MILTVCIMVSFQIADYGLSRDLCDDGMDSTMYVYNEYTYTLLVHFRVTSHPECTHILGSSKAQY